MTPSARAPALARVWCTRARAALLALTLAACSGGGSDGNSALAELERMAFVPPGECVLQPRSGAALLCENRQALLVDRFEASRGDWLHWYQSDREPKDPLFVELLASWGKETANWPASFMNAAEARRYAAARGMRLLTVREWMRTACGTRQQPWPWGQNNFTSVANTLELELGRPMPVGTFEQGRTPLSTYDMLGNVWEWVEEPPLSPAEDHALQTWAMGGSYLTRQRRLHEIDHDGRLMLFAEELDVGARAADVGVRCAVEAESYLRAHVRSWGAEEAARERLTAIGAAWGHEAVPLLEKLAQDAQGARDFGALLEGARR